MLTLTKAPGESFQIGDHIRVTIQRFKSGSVVVSIDAPRDVYIHRNAPAVCSDPTEVLECAHDDAQ